jgi:hypothetical protein
VLPFTNNPKIVTDNSRADAKNTSINQEKNYEPIRTKLVVV